MSTGQGADIAIVDYGLGNLYSLARACAHAGLSTVVSDDKAALQGAKAVLLPGVGAFSEAMNALRARDLPEFLIDLAAAGKPLIGICLGLQLLMTESHEFGVHAGLGLIDGTVERLPEGAGHAKVPHVGWAPVAAAQPWDGTVLADVDDGAYFYFVHSYVVKPTDPSVALCTSRSGDAVFCAGVAKDNIVGLQFHPERSARVGLAVYDNIARWISERN